MIATNLISICCVYKEKLFEDSRMLQFSEFVWALSYSVWDVFKNFLLTDATDRNKISSDQKRFFIALSLYPLSFFANTPFKVPLLCGSVNTKIIYTHVAVLILCIQNVNDRRQRRILNHECDVFYHHRKWENIIKE